MAVHVPRSTTVDAGTFVGGSPDVPLAQMSRLGADFLFGGLQSSGWEVLSIEAQFLTLQTLGDCMGPL